MSWRILQRLFNTAPWEDAEYFTDKYDRQLWFTWGTHLGLGPKLWVYYRGEWVATVESAQNEEGGLDLCDIVIFEDNRNLRNCGIGKKMLDLLLRHKSKAQNLFGDLFPHMTDLR